MPYPGSKQLKAADAAKLERDVYLVTHHGHPRRRCAHPRRAQRPPGLLNRLGVAFFCVERGRSGSGCSSRSTTRTRSPGACSSRDASSSHMEVRLRGVPRFRFFLRLRVALFMPSRGGSAESEAVAAHAAVPHRALRDGTRMPIIVDSHVHGLHVVRPGCSTVF
jgi:hypothetical protein